MLPRQTYFNLLYCALIAGTPSAPPEPLSHTPSTSSVADSTIHRAVKQAGREIDAAVNATLHNLFGYHGNARDHGSLMKLLRFPDESARSIARAADVYERTLTHIRKHVQAGLKMNLSEGWFKFVLNNYDYNLIIIIYEHF